MSSGGFLDLSKYQLQGKTGKGAFCSTYIIKAIDSNDVFEAKISPEIVNPNSPSEKLNIIREANILSKLSYPSITKYIGCSPIDFEKKQRPVLVTEFYKNGSLSSIIYSEKMGNSNPKWNMTKKLCSIFGIASGMQFLNSHSFKIIHRNLTTENILLDDNFYPKITGFDYACIHNQKVLKNQGITGTPLYLAPEIWENGEYSEASDVYAFSIIIYQILVGKIPFTQKNVFEFGHDVVRNVRPKFESFNVPDSYRKLIERCWSQDPNQRPSFSQIVQILKEEKGFITKDVDEKEYLEYINYIEKFDFKFDETKEVIHLSGTTEKQKKEDLNKIFKVNSQNVKYRVIQEAKQEISRLSTHFRFYNNLKIDIDIEKLKKDSCDRYLQISELKGDDPKTKEILKDINKTIEYEYNQLYNQLKFNQIRLSSFIVINQIYNVFKTIGFKDKNKMQVEINKILDEHPEDLLFNKEKLRQISTKDADLSQIFESIAAIKNNPIYRFEKRIETPIKSTLYSKKFSYSKSLSNVLSGNCIFIALYGKSTETHRVLSSISNDKIDISNDDLISIYGPVDFVSYAKTVNNSIDKLKHFYGNFPNLFFIEISNELKSKDEVYERWCRFISYVSSFTIFCSDKKPKNEEIEKFNNLLMPKYSKSLIINCSPITDEPIKFGKEKRQVVNIDIDSLNENLLRNYTFNEICEKKLEFIPYETAALISQQIIDKDYQKILDVDRTEYYKRIMDDYSYNLHNKSIEYFHKLVNVEQSKIHLLIKQSGEENFISDFHLDQITNRLKDKAQEFLFTNCYPELWDNEKIKESAKVLNFEIEDEMRSFCIPFKQIELIGELKQTKLSNSSKVLEILGKLRESKILDIRALPKTEEEIQNFNSKINEAYKFLVSNVFEGIETDAMMDSLYKQLYDFLNENPTATSNEYGTFYSELYKKNYSPGDYRISKCFDCITKIREVPFEFRPHEFIVRIGAESFIGLNIQPNSFYFRLTKTTTTHDLYELTKKALNLGNVPFYLVRFTVDGQGRPTQVEIFDDDSFIYELNSNEFVALYGSIHHSTKSFIESMITKKRIKISDDFIIETNSKNNDFLVEFPSNHNGWLDVPFDIKNKNENEKTEALIHLKLSANDISYLQEGNSCVHQYYKDNQWITEDDPVFLKYPTCDTALVLLRHCSTHRITRRNTRTFSEFVPEELLNTQHSRNWEGEDGNIGYNRGGKPYYLPVGYFSEGILVNNFNQNTCVGFHGTRKRKLESIIRNGYLLPSQLPEGVRPGHISIDETVFGIPHFANAIFVSPSIKYASYYGKDNLIGIRNGEAFVESGHIRNNKIILVIVQVRVNLNSFTVNKNTTLFIFNDPHFSEDVLEWRIPNTSDLFPYRILYKFMSLDDYDNSFIFNERLYRSLRRA